MQFHEDAVENAVISVVHPFPNDTDNRGRNNPWDNEQSPEKFLETDFHIQENCNKQTKDHFKRKRIQKPCEGVLQIFEELLVSE